MSTTTDLTTLKINYLTQAQYDAAVDGGTINENEIYMTPAEDELEGTLQIKQANGSFVTVTDCARLPVQSLIANITATQSGSGTPSSSNIRAISGWDSVNVTRTGTNVLLPFERTTVTTGVTAIVNSDGSVSLNGTSTTVGGVLLVENQNVKNFKSGTYYAKLFGAVSGLTIQAYNNTSSFFSSESGSFTFAANSTSNYIRIRWASGTVLNNITVYPMLVLGTTEPTSFEVYNGTTVTTTLPSTVYGGTLDVTTGKLTATHGYIASYAGETLPSTWISDRDVYASGSTPTTGAQVVYELASSQSYRLTTPELSMVLGTNNVWADSGDIELSYIAAN